MQMNTICEAHEEKNRKIAKMARFLNFKSPFLKILRVSFYKKLLLESILHVDYEYRRTSFSIRVIRLQISKNESVTI